VIQRNSLANNKTEEFQNTKHMEPHKMCKMKIVKIDKKMQSKKYNVLKSQITKSDLKSHNKGLYPKLEKV
jgi:hypothetical protein